MGENVKRPELLAPAGNREKLEIAVRYGADAVYLGGKSFSLRGMAGNFTPDEMASAVDYCHTHKVRAYLTVNSYPFNHELDELVRFLEEIAHIPFDACILADPGVLQAVRRILPEREIHLSTQANTVNWLSARFWRDQGVKRVNLAREMSLDAIRETVERVPDLETEIFVHGALCISHSGRCLLSSILTGRDANRGTCTHPCRWSYHLVEETRPGEYFPVMEEDGGTFIFNSRDLCLLEHLPALVQSGTTSFKIEGRMKGISYLASVLRVYRRALDEYLENPQAWICRPEWMEELAKLSHRGYTTGLLFGQPRDVGQEYDSAYVRTHEFVGKVAAVGKDGTVVIEVRNRIMAGDELEFIGPGMRSDRLRVGPLPLLDRTTDAVALAETAHPNQWIALQLPFPVEPNFLIRREREYGHH